MHRAPIPVLHWECGYAICTAGYHFFHLSKNRRNPPFEPDELTLDGNKLPEGRQFDDTRKTARTALARDLKIRIRMNIRT